jgi:hypothetical protein
MFHHQIQVNFPFQPPIAKILLSAEATPDGGFLHFKHESIASQEIQIK